MSGLFLSPPASLHEALRAGVDNSPFCYCFRFVVKYKQRKNNSDGIRFDKSDLSLCGIPQDKKYMHKKISSRLALEIILLLAIMVGGYTLIKYQQLNYLSMPTSITINSKPNVSNDSCKVHAYEGEAKIRGWYLNDGNEWLLVVSDEDMEKLPNYDGTEEYKLKNQKIKLIDATSQIENKLRLTSEKKPQSITITGYAMRCDGVPLASIDYKKGMFRKYMNI
jgi:hypothetical protein